MSVFSLFSRIQFRLQLCCLALGSSDWRPLAESDVDNSTTHSSSKTERSFSLALLRDNRPLLKKSEEQNENSSYNVTSLNGIKSFSAAVAS